MYKNKFMAALEAERIFLGMRYASKRTHWSFMLWWIVDQILKIFGHKGILDHFITVIGNTIYFPGKETKESYSESMLAQVLNHELQHKVDLNNEGFFTYAWRGLKYLVSKKYRAKIERKGYLRSLESMMIIEGQITESDSEFVVEMLSGASYFKMMEKEKAREWVSRAHQYLKLLDAQNKLPMKRDKEVRGLTD